MSDLALKKQNTRIWIDLSGFSGKGRDYGVRDCLNNMGFIPSAVSLMSCCPDLVHEHDGIIDDTPLRWEYSCYGAWKRDYRWTRKSLRRVVDELRKYGTKVFLSCMANAYHSEFEMMSGWAKSHKELFLVHRTGLHGFRPDGKFASLCFYNIAARFKDGTWYEDFFARQVSRAVVDYGFDGFHAADGYKSFVLGIMEAGFSPDMLEQFENDGRIALPDYKGPLTEAIPPVARWIWKNKRAEWIDFWRRRLARSWTKVAKELKAAKKDFVINSCWCTDPLESIARYGMDTTVLEEVHTESVYFETMEIYSIMGPVSGPQSKRREGYILEGHEAYPSSLIAALLRGTHTPKTKTYAMIHVHDQFERFEFLKSGRAHLEKSIIGFQQLYRIRNGKLEPATTGIWPAVPKEVSSEDWLFLSEAEKLARSIRPSEIPGAVALWSESTIETEISTSNKHWSVHRTIYELAGSGCPIIAAAHVREIPRLKRQALFWPNPTSFTEQEQERIWKAAKDNTLILFDFKGAFTIPHGLNALSIVDGHSGAKLSIVGGKTQLDSLKERVFDEAKLMRAKNLLASVRRRGSSIIVTPSAKARPYEYREEMAGHFMTRVPPTRLAMPYLELVAEIARRVAWPLISEVRVHEGPRAGELAGHEDNLFYVRSRRNRIYLFALNLHRYASYLKVRWAKPVLKSEQLNSVMFHPKPQGRETELMIPSMGITVCDVQLKT